jgi:hypothetical protein
MDIKILTKKWDYLQDCHYILINDYKTLILNIATLLSI